ncbi:MAG: erythromycin esterase family protein [Candidatus Eremiobacteraeota bacterium]|nr:erythromycin esterase family protein [Candidatus Eremiobacteraeota bacterium]
MESRVAVDLAHAIAPLTVSVGADDTLFAIVADAPVVLIGESTHGTYEFARARAEITKRLIEDRGCTAVCIEDDWPDAYRVNRYVRGSCDDEDAAASLGGFKRFPAWLWRNRETVDFIEWLREYNGTAAKNGKPGVSFYGLDLYCTHACLDAAHRDPSLDQPASTWVARDRHMLDTLQELRRHSSAREDANKLVVWTHNGTTLGALARRHFGDDAVSIGFTTYSGWVTAAAHWRAPAERTRIVPALGDSYEYLFHSMNVARFLVPLRPHRPKLAGLPSQARERAIGAVYRPQSELASHYFTARLLDQFDAVYHFDVTRALEPLDRGERA